MKRRVPAGRLSLALVVVFTLACSLSASRRTRSPGRSPIATPGSHAPLTDLRRADAGTRERVRATYARLPMSFVRNQGQEDPRVRFVSRSRGYTLFLTPEEAVLCLAPSRSAPSRCGEARPGRAPGPDRSHRASAPAAVRSLPVSAAAKAPRSTVLRVKLLGANPRPQVAGLDPLPGTINYLIGSDRAKWRTRIPQYARVRYQAVYPGVDLVYYGNPGELEFDFLLSPGARPERIRLGFEGARRLEIDARGDLLLHTPAGEVRQKRPRVYQRVGGERRKVECRYVLRSRNQVGFQVARYDAAKPLVIDPILTCATYLGGSPIYRGANLAPGGNDFGYGITVDAAGNAYVTGWTDTSTFPVKNSLQSAYTDSRNIFAAKLNLNATGAASLVYSTYLGRGVGYGVAVDSRGDAYLAGHSITDSGYYGFVIRLSAAGDAIVYSTSLGRFIATSIALDAANNAYVTGYVLAGVGPFPITSGAFQKTPGGGRDAFVTKLDASGSIVYSTYLGGRYDENSGQSYIDETLDRGSIAVDAAGNAYVAGDTSSDDFPTTAGAFQPSFGGGQVDRAYKDGFVAKLNPSGSALVYSTYLGGKGDDFCRGIAVDSSGSAIVTGQTTSSNFPSVNAEPIDRSGGSANAIFVTKIDPSGASVAYSVRPGGQIGEGIAIDARGNAWIAGKTVGLGYPMQNPTQGSYAGGGSDGIIAEISPSGALLFSTYLGGRDWDIPYAIAVSEAQSVYVTGWTASLNFPMASDGLPTGIDPSNTYWGDAFVAKIVDVPAPDGIAVFRPSTREWLLRRPDAHASVVQFGGPGDRPVAADYFALGHPQVAIFRPATQEWFLRAPDSGAVRVPFGGPDDIPVPGDYLKLGRAQLAVFRTTTQEWFIRRDDGSAARAQFGGPGDVPVPADYFGLGRAQLAVFRPGTAEWFLRTDLGGAVPISWGDRSDVPTPGDYLGLGRAQIAVFRPSTAQWLIRKDDGQPVTVSFGSPGDMPVPADYFNLGRLQIGVYRPSTGEWLLRTDRGETVRVPWGGPEDRPVPGDFLAR